MAIISVKGVIPSFSDIEYTLPIGVSVLGTLLYDDITFPANRYRTLNNDIISYDAVVLQSVRVVVSQEKNIVKTQVSGRNGTVKEYNSEGDYIINLTADINEVLNVFPADQLIAFKQLKDAPVSVPIVSKLLNSILGIDYVVISNFSIDPKTGKGNVVLSMRLESDIPFSLKDFEVL